MQEGTDRQREKIFAGRRKNRKRHKNHKDISLLVLVRFVAHLPICSVARPQCSSVLLSAGLSPLRFRRVRFQLPQRSHGKSVSDLLASDVDDKRIG